MEFGWSIGSVFAVIIGALVIVGLAFAAGPLIALIVALLLAGALLVPVFLTRRRNRVGSSDRLVGPPGEQEETLHKRSRGEPASGGG